MASLTEIRTALKMTISAAIPSLNGYDKMPESVNAPAFVVLPDPNATVEYMAMGRGVDKFNLMVILIVSQRDNDLAQIDLDPYVSSFGPKSIRQAVFNGRTLGLPDVDAAVTGVSNYGDALPIGGVDYVGARLSVEVFASGTA